MCTLMLRAARPPTRQRRSSNGPPVWYRVIGLPAGHQAKIRETRNGWQILSTVDGVPGYWSGSYPTRAAAVAVLQGAEVPLPTRIVARRRHVDGTEVHVVRVSAGPPAAFTWRSNTRLPSATQPSAEEATLDADTELVRAGHDCRVLGCDGWVTASPAVPE